MPPVLSYGDTLLARCAEIIAEHEALVQNLRDGDAGAFAESLREDLGKTYGTSLRGLCPDPQLRCMHPWAGSRTAPVAARGSLSTTPD